MDSDSIQDAQVNIAKLQSALDDAQQMLQAAERAQEAAQRAHEAAEGHAKVLRTVSLIAIGVIVVAVLLGFRRRHA
jgi:DNA-binding transcriptional LysR family regulator